jgi:hypothetical protein
MVGGGIGIMIFPPTGASATAIGITMGVVAGFRFISRAVDGIRANRALDKFAVQYREAGSAKDVAFIQKTKGKIWRNLAKSTISDALWMIPGTGALKLVGMAANNLVTGADEGLTQYRNKL